MSDTFSSAAAPPDRFTRPIAAMLSYSVAAMIVGQSCLFTVLPPIGRQVGLVDYQIGLIMSVHGLFMLFTGPIAGALSEKRGRRRILVAGSALYAISILSFGLIINSALNGLVAGTALVVSLVASRAVFAMGAGAVMPGSMALAADLSSRENRLKAMALLGGSISAGAMIGPSFAAVFTGLGPSAPFYLIAAFGLGGAVVARFVLPEPKPTVLQGPTGVSANLWFARPGIIALGNAVYLIGCYGIYSILGFMFQDRFTLSTEDAAQVMGFSLMGSAATNVLTQTFIVRKLKIGPATMLVIAIPLTAIGFLTMDVSGTIPLVILGMMINAVGQAIANSAFATALSLSAGPTVQGRIAGMSTSAQAVAFLVGPASSAAIYQANPDWPFFIGSALVLAALITAWFAPAKPSDRDPSSREETVVR